jgi:hypothetical protein
VIESGISGRAMRVTRMRPREFRLRRRRCKIS